MDVMARGWESKSVEAQQEARDARTEPAGPASAEEAERAARRATLELMRSRALADLAQARSHAHRQMLEAAIRALDEQLKALAGQ
jgi:hypothetical protein